MIKALFTDHPASVGETYGEHLGVALSFSGRLCLASAVCLIHALLPFLFDKTASGLVGNLHDRMVMNRARRAAPPLADPATR